MKLRFQRSEDRLRRARKWRAIVMFVLLGVGGGATAQERSSPVVAAASEAVAARQQARADNPQKTDAEPSVSQEQALYLVRATMLTLNDANRSGNYTVFRDLAAPDFQARNSAADLAQSFVDLRHRDFDLFATALLTPQFTAQPARDANGRLRLMGFFPTRPLQITFDLIFQSVKGQWRLLSISVATPEAPKQTQSQLDGRTMPHSPGPLYSFRILSGTVGWRW